MESTDRTAELVQLITAIQRRLYAYILSLVQQPAEADDILQETNLVLWQKSGEFELGTNFDAWACRIAHFQVMAYRRRMLRDRAVFNDQLVDTLAAEAEARIARFDDRRKALLQCVEGLGAHERELIDLRYRESGSVTHIARKLGRTAGAVSQALYRIRGSLMQCIEGKLAAETES